jgi:hypothetical protein
MSLQSLATYTLYQCTWWAAKLADWVQPGWGNADQWAESAARAGFNVTQTPTPGSIAVWSGALPGSGGFGHVAEVTGLVPGGFTVAEGNFTTPNQPDTRTVTGAGLNDLIGFIQPPGGGMSSNPIDNLPVVGGLVQSGLVAPGLDTVFGAGQSAVAQGQAGLATIGTGIASIPVTVGHGLADALGVGIEDVKTFAQRQVIALAVAAVVLVVLFVR